MSDNRTRDAMTDGPQDFVERVARLFHAAYESHAPSHGYETRSETAVPWDDLPENNRNLMLATVAEVVGILGLTLCPVVMDEHRPRWWYHVHHSDLNLVDHNCRECAGFGCPACQADPFNAEFFHAE